MGEPAEPYDQMTLSGPASGSHAYACPPEAPASSIDPSQLLTNNDLHVSHATYRSHSEPASPNTIRHRPHSPTTSPSMQNQELPPSGTIYHSPQQQLQRSFSPTNPPLQTTPRNSYLSAHGESPPNRLRSHQYPHHSGIPQKRPLPPTSAPTTPPQPLTPNPTQYQFLAYQDQTTLVMGLLSHLDRLTKECEEMRAFIRLGYSDDDTAVGLRRQVEG
ncbi:MAG: hypothetical protein M1840_007164 [Geoglossum simile]|nr:MAG: hypothetical protein M1840_007164 [Geoglossum simile]